MWLSLAKTAAMCPTAQRTLYDRTILNKKTSDASRLLLYTATAHGKHNLGRLTTPPSPGRQSPHHAGPLRPAAVGRQPHRPMKC
mmetsp:Transcript_51180/g.116287  ORF Transcript_51180/g.116287 Transcript_51180/m.116287 type:complete len:84 (-) Transcript_51180:483-734(-)